MNKIVLVVSILGLCLFASITLLWTSDKKSEPAIDGHSLNSSETIESKGKQKSGTVGQTNRYKEF